MGSGLSFASGERLCSQSRNSDSFNSIEYEMINLKDKKKKTSRFATICKRFIKARRHNRQHDYAKQVKEFTASWSIAEIENLADEYECMSSLKELATMANMARSNGSSIVEDLSSLFQNKYCADVDLVYLGIVYPAHRAILCVRCAFFRDLLFQIRGHRPKVDVHLKTQGVDNELFLALLRYLYTGDFGISMSSLQRMKPVLSQLAMEFGAPNSLKQDLRTLFETGIYSDAVLAFSEGADSQCYSPNNPSQQQHKLFQWKPNKNFTFPMPCHKAILAARSSFFRNLINRRSKNEVSSEKGDYVSDCSNKKTVILLDEMVIPARFASILMSSIYLDHIDLISHIQQQTSYINVDDNTEQIRPTASCCNSKKFLFQHLTSASVSLPSSTTHSTTNNPVPTSLSSSIFTPPILSSQPPSFSPLEEAMEMYHIATFLDFATLAQSSEDMVADELSVQNLLHILHWSSQSHGSTWVYRQAIHFLCEEFLTFSQSPSFYHLDKTYLLQVLQSDFLQASELDLLNVIIKWAEYRLIKSIEEQEPNLLSNTAHSVSRKGVKRRDLSGQHLLQTISDLLAHIRLEHIVPRTHEWVISAAKRGLIPCISSHQPAYPSHLWLNDDNVFSLKPRLFVPFYEEIKLLIKDHHAKCDQQQVNLTRSCYGNMNGSKNTCNRSNQRHHSTSHHRRASTATPSPPSHHHHHHHHTENDLHQNYHPLVHFQNIPNSTPFSPNFPHTSSHVISPSLSNNIPSHPSFNVNHSQSHNLNFHPNQNYNHPNLPSIPHPDTLYMLHPLHNDSSLSSSTVDIIAGTLLVPDKKVLKAMQKRYTELSVDCLINNNISNNINNNINNNTNNNINNNNYHSALSYQIRLRVVREFGLPDSAVKVLKGFHTPPPLITLPSETTHHSLSRPQSPHNEVHHFCQHHTLHRFPIFSKNKRSGNCINYNNNNTNINNINNGSNNSFCRNNNNKKRINSCCNNNKCNNNKLNNNKVNNKYNDNDDEMWFSESCSCDNKSCFQAGPSLTTPSHLRSHQMSHNANTFFRSSSSFSATTASSEICHPKYNCRHHQHKDSSASSSHTSSVATTMPDIAMATTATTATNHSDLMTLSDLDLGDGSSHSNNTSLFI